MAYLTEDDLKYQIQFSYNETLMISIKDAAK